MHRLEFLYLRNLAPCMPNVKVPWLLHFDIFLVANVPEAKIIMVATGYLATILFIHYFDAVDRLMMMS